MLDQIPQESKPTRQIYQVEFSLGEIIRGQLVASEQLFLHISFDDASTEALVSESRMRYNSLGVSPHFVGYGA